MKTLQDYFEELYKDFYDENGKFYNFNKFAHRFESENHHMLSSVLLDKDLNIILDNSNPKFKESFIKIYNEEILPRKEKILLNIKLEEKLKSKGIKIKKDKI